MPSTTTPPSPLLPQKTFNPGYYERFFIEKVKLGKGFRGSVFSVMHVLNGIVLGEFAVKKGNQKKGFNAIFPFILLLTP